MHRPTPARSVFSAARIAPAAVLFVFAAFAPAVGNAQSSGCYKGTCSGLDSAARGSNYGQLDLTGLGDVTHALTGVSGGDVDASYLGRTPFGPCVGRVTALPDHLVTVDDWTDLRLEARSDGDITMLVHGPDGWRCNDDARGTNPGMTAEFEPGTYRVWIGSYSRGYHDYELAVTSLGDDRDPVYGDWDDRPRSPNARWPEPGSVRPRPPRRPVYVPEPITWSFDGAFEDVDVSFVGGSPDDVYRDCMAFAAASDSLDWVDDVTVHGRSYHYTASYWSPDSLCAIAVLNAVSSAGGEHGVSGMVEDVPFSVGCHGVEARRVLEQYLPRAVADAWVDDITVDGVRHHNGSGYWSTDEVTAIVSANIVDPRADYVARGTIEDTPFTFAGRSPSAIRAECTQFVDQAMSDAWIDDVTVNGASRHNATGWWSAADVCMIVSSLADAP